MTAEELEAGKDFGRYKDVDGDGIPWRTLPGTHPTKGSYFTRGTTRDPYARYSERGPDYIYNVERLLRKFATAATLVPQPVLRPRRSQTPPGRDLFRLHQPGHGTRRWRRWTRQGIHLDAHAPARLPVPGQRGASSSPRHDEVFVVEQNRDAQMRTLLVNELDVDPARLMQVLHYDGTPITARFITAAITGRSRRSRSSPARAAAQELLT